MIDVDSPYTYGRRASNLCRICGRNAFYAPKDNWPPLLPIIKQNERYVFFHEDQETTEACNMLHDITKGGRV